MSQIEEMHQPGPPRPPRPPVRPPGPPERPDIEDYIEQLRETIDVQARTIRFLLTNYEHLLRKVEEHDPERHHLVVEYSVGESKTFAANARVPMGWWMVISSGSHSIHHDHESESHAHSYEQFEVLFSNGTARKTSGTVILAPIETKIVRKEEEEEH